MNLGLLEGWAAGGPAGLTPPPAGAATSDPATAEGATDPAFRVLMDLFAVPAPVFPRGDADGMVRVESPVIPWPSALARVILKDTQPLPVAPASDSADDDEQAVDQLLAGLFACAELTPIDRAVAQTDAPTTAVPTTPVCDESAETPIAAATSFVRPAPVAAQPERSFELPQNARIGKAVRAAEHSESAVGAAVSSIAPGAIAAAEALASHDREQSESEPSESDARKQPQAMSVQAGTRITDTDRNAAMPEFATSAGRVPINTPGGDAQVSFKTPLKASAPSITFTGPFTQAAHAILASRLHAAALQSPQAPASLPGTTAAQIVQTIQLAWTRHGGEARITLDPEQFGDLSVAMRVDRGVVVARVQADTPQVREWLHANLDTLRTGLAEHHLRLDRLEIAATDDARESENREAGQRDDKEPSSHPRRSRRHRSDQLFVMDA